MTSVAKLQNPYGDGKLIESCGLFSMMDTSGRPLPGGDVLRAMANMRDRGNGLGGGFAAYGIYPEFRDRYALHLMYETQAARAATETFLRDRFSVRHAEEIPHRASPGVTRAPILWRYFVAPGEAAAGDGDGDGDECARDGPADDYVVLQVMAVNTGIDGAFVFSSGKNMGVFKGVGYPEDIGRFFCLDQYEGYLWVGHSRFPTNTPGWWGGAHPFSILDWTVVHNGELSSYGTNRWFLEMYGYFCTMQTDTEVLAYAVDLLARRHGLPIDLVARVFAAPFWTEIDRLPAGEREAMAALRATFGPLLMNGPFTVIISHHGEMIGLGDRIRLRPLVAGVKGEVLYLASEEAPIRLVCPDVERTWSPKGGEAVIGRLGVKHAIAHAAVGYAPEAAAAGAAGHA